MDRYSSEAEPQNGAEKQVTDTEIKRYFGQLLQGGDLLSRLICIVAGIFILFPAMALVTGDFDFLNNLPIKYHFAATAVGSLLFFCFYFPDRSYWYFGVLSGLFTGPLILFAIELYLMKRTSFYSAELIIPVILGGIPGFLIWFFPLRHRFIKDYRKRLHGPHRFNP